MQEILNDFLNQKITDSITLAVPNMNPNIMLPVFSLFSSIASSLIIGLIIFLLLKFIPPFSKIDVIIHEYGHYKHLNDVVCPKLNVQCECFTFGLRNNHFFYEGKTFNSVYNTLSSLRHNAEYQKLIADNSKFGCLFYCKTILIFFFSLSLLNSILFSYQYGLVWCMCGLFLTSYEILTYFFAKNPSADISIARHPENFKYTDNYNEYAEIYSFRKIR